MKLLPLLPGRLKPHHLLILREDDVAGRKAQRLLDLMDDHLAAQIRGLLVLRAGVAVLRWRCGNAGPQHAITRHTPQITSGYTLCCGTTVSYVA